MYHSTWDHWLLIFYYAESNSDDMYDSSERENSEFAEYFGDFHNVRLLKWFHKNRAIHFAFICGPT